MQRLLSALFFLAAVLTALRPAAADLTPITITATKPTIWCCGDSTCKNSGAGANGSALVGWGTPLANYFDAAKCTVTNVGHGGRSSLTYYQNDWQTVLPQIKSGDYVLIVFGINDGTTPGGIGDEIVNGNHTFGWYMGHMALEAAAKGAHPIFLTITVRNIWTNPLVQFTDGTPIGPLPPNYDPTQDRLDRSMKYTPWIKQVAAKYYMPCFDLYNCGCDVYQTIGRATVNTWYSDHNHTYLVGADMAAQVIVSGLKTFKNSPFTALLSAKGKAIATCDPQYAINNLRPATPVAMGLTHRYSFNANAADSVGNIAGTLKGAAQITGGKLVLDNGAKLSSDATLSYLEFGGALLPPSGSVSIAFWYTGSATPQFSRVLDIGDRSGTNGQAFIYFTPRNTSNLFRAAISASDTSRIYMDGPRVDDGAAHAVVMSIDGLNRLLHVYVDGKEPTAAISLGSNALNNVRQVHSWLGRSGYDHDPGLAGSIDEFRVYNAALTLTQAAAIAAAGPDVLPK